MSMGIGDGFWLWIGKELAELALFVAILVTLGVGFTIACLCDSIVTRRRRKSRQPPGGGETK